MATNCVIGRHGLIGSALARKLGEVTPFPTPDTKALFHFGSYVHTEFEKNPEWHMKQTIDSFTSLLPYCREHGILFVYPSSALVYEPPTQFSQFKMMLELLVRCYDVRSLGLRIFPTYGPGEKRTVISQWIRAMRSGNPPIVYGDGEQWRDFIYVDDAVDDICSYASCGANVGGARQHVVVDIGSGVKTTFNSIVDTINFELGTRFVPKYVEVPEGYRKGILCKDPPIPRSTRVTLHQGVRRILESLEVPELATA